MVSETMKTSRRSFLKTAAAMGAWLIWAGPARSSSVHWQERRDLYPQGVASGDPDPHSVILWTRRPFDEGTRQLLTVEVAEDEAFGRVIAHAQAPVSSASDWTARVLIGGLKPARTYWYRFTDTDGNGSRVGRTITAPSPDDSRTVNFAFVSCQDINEGKLNAYRRMIYEDERAPAAEQLGFVLHLGDFIYEVVEYPDEVKTRFDRTIYEVARIQDGHKVGNFHIPLTLDGYRAIYKGYLADPDLQDARARWPFVCIWDNHEFSWQGWQSIVKAGRFERPGQSIKIAANQAWFEYLPARVTAPSGSLERFDPPAVQGCSDHRVRQQWAGHGTEQLDGDQQPEGLPGAAVRPAPGRDHHRPAQLSEPESLQRSVPGQAGRGIHEHGSRVDDAGARRWAWIQRRQSSCGNPIQ
jgi:alkaline phosphatase D